MPVEGPRIDLHTHSTASDGTVSPADLMAWAAEVQLDVVALTDHDTFAGIEAAAAVLPAGLTLLPGVELSCAFNLPDGGRVSLHLLGYLPDRTHPRLVQEMTDLRNDRLRRAREMIDLMQSHGAKVTYEQVQGIAGHDAIGRPHMARALVEAQAIARYEDAWTADWIATEGRCWVAKRALEPVDGVRLVREAGGIPVLAHPGSLGRGHAVPAGLIEDMADAGLVGLEVDHPEHDGFTRRRLGALAAELKLVPTGSSDFHGHVKPNRLGQETTSVASYERLLAAAGRSASRIVGPVGG